MASSETDRNESSPVSEFLSGLRLAYLNGAFNRLTPIRQKNSDMRDRGMHIARVLAAGEVDP